MVREVMSFSMVLRVSGHSSKLSVLAASFCTLRVSSVHIPTQLDLDQFGSKSRIRIRPHRMRKFGATLNASPMMLAFPICTLQRRIHLRGESRDEQMHSRAEVAVGMAYNCDQRSSNQCWHLRWRCQYWNTVRQGSR